MPFAEQVAEAGKVYVTDIDPDMIQRMAVKIKEQNVTNIKRRNKILDYLIMKWI